MNETTAPTLDMGGNELKVGDRVYSPYDPAFHDPADLLEPKLLEEMGGTVLSLPKDGGSWPDGEGPIIGMRMDSGRQEVIGFANYLRIGERPDEEFEEVKRQLQFDRMFEQVGFGMTYLGRFDTWDGINEWWVSLEQTYLRRLGNF